MSALGRYKNFPPGWDHLKIPLSSRGAALAALAMYAPCRPRAIWLQRAAWTWIRLLGPRTLPGSTMVWQPPLAQDWPELSESLRAALGPFDEVAGYVRAQTSRTGMALLLLQRGVPLAFVKMRQGESAALRNEAMALTMVAKYAPRSFRVPAPLHQGCAAGWQFFAVAPLPAGLHRAPSNPPLQHVLLEVREALAGIPRAPEVPAGWLPMHGDFAPWNLRSTRAGGLFLIDWENAGWGPPAADEAFYLATAVALDEGPVPRGIPPEAACFWRDRLIERPGNARDLRLATSLRSVLDRMTDGDRGA